MEELSREGHRQRMRDTYLAGGMDYMPDHNVLELFLSIVIPRKDVKQISYDLINTFGSIRGVIEASPESLMNVKGVGESSAVAISLIRVLYARSEKCRNESLSTIHTMDDAVRYCKNLVGFDVVEKVMQICVSSDGKVVNVHHISTGTLNSASVNAVTLVQNLLNDKATNTIITHNHPNAPASPSAEDINTTIALDEALNKVGMSLVEHVVIGSDNEYSLIKRDYLNR